MVALAAITNGQLSDAADVNQYRNLFRGGFVHDVKNGYGATGDGVTDDTATFVTARNAAGTWGEVYVPAGTYIIGGFSFNVTGQHWTFARGAILKTKSGDAVGVDITATDVVLEGGEWDGNRSGAVGATSVIIQAGADRVTIRKFRIHNNNNSAVLGYGKFTTIQDCELWDSSLSCILISENADGAEITGNYIHNVPAGYYGIDFHGTDPNITRRPRITNNYIELGATGIGIEVWGLVPGAVISGNVTIGGDMGVSVAASDHTVVSGNHLTGMAYAGIEVAGSQFCAVTGNTIVGTGTATDGGIFVSTLTIPSRFHEISGNTIYNTATAIVVYQSDHVNIGPNVLHTFNPAGIWFNASHHGTVTGVTFYNPSVASDGVLFDNSNHGIVTGCDFENTSVGVGCTATGTDNIRVIGNRFTNVSFKLNNFAGANRKAALNDPTTGDTVVL